MGKWEEAVILYIYNRRDAEPGYIPVASAPLQRLASRDAMSERMYVHTYIHT